MPSVVRTYPQDKPQEWLKSYPQERWRCDIFPDDGSDHHGIGSTEAEAMMNASRAYMRWLGQEDPVAE